MTAPALRASGLVRRYGDLVAVDGLDLEIHRGECFGLLGPNGAGKTTTVEIFEGLNEPSSGDVEVLGLRWSESADEIRRRIGVQLQETKFPEKLRLGEVVTLWRSFYPSGLEPETALRRVSLHERSSAMVRELSGGQKQRLSLACALVGDPEVLFLDEPTTGLDPASRRQIWDIVEELRSRGRTILLTTHYMEEADRLCDRVAILDHGRRLAQGTPAELIAGLGAEHVVEVETDDDTLAPDALAGLPGVAEVVRTGDAWRLTAADATPVLGPLLGLIESRGATVRRLAIHQATLEDVFLAHAGHGLQDSDTDGAAA